MTGPWKTLARLSYMVATDREFVGPLIVRGTSFA